MLDPSLKFIVLLRACLATSSKFQLDDIFRWRAKFVFRVKGCVCDLEALTTKEGS